MLVPLLQTGRRATKGVFRQSKLSFSSLNTAYKHVLHPEDRLNPKVISAEYAVRGKLVLMAEDLQNRLRAGEKLNFDEIIFCNIGNPQSVGQKPLTYMRQVISLAANPDLLSEANIETTKKLFPADIVERAREFHKNTAGGLGAYSHSKGIPWIRNKVCEYIQSRDGAHVPVDPEKIFLTNGASDGVSRSLELLIRHENDGVMIPIPQYPLYSATVTLLGGRQIGYYLDEAKGWGFEKTELERAWKEAVDMGAQPRAIAVINPGNPTGQILSKQNMEEVINFCYERNLVLMADEVYQTNNYSSEKEFYSFKKVLHEMGGEIASSQELLSFHSTSKGFLGECGFRGGYMEVTNLHPEVEEQLYKLISIGLCSNIAGQLMTELMINPPKPQDESYSVYVAERDGILTSLSRRAAKLAAAFNKMDGVSCNDSDGAMYLFPTIEIPPAACDEARSENMEPDVFYCVKLLEATGICTVPGSGFGQVNDTWHLRTTFLPSEDKIEKVISLMADFHADFMKKYK